MINSEREPTSIIDYKRKHVSSADQPNLFWRVVKLGIEIQTFPFILKDKIFPKKEIPQNVVVVDFKKQGPTAS